MRRRKRLRNPLNSEKGGSLVSNFLIMIANLVLYIPTGPPLPAAPTILQKIKL